jgi:hypothetical protein
MDPYSVLGVAPTAREDEVKAAYRARSRLLHPDVHRDARGHSPQAAHEAFSQLCDAYRLALGGLEAATRRSETGPDKPDPRSRARGPEVGRRRPVAAGVGEGGPAPHAGHEALTLAGLAVIGWLLVSDFVPALVQYSSP